jgi:hypothetical protein
VAFPVVDGLRAIEFGTPGESRRLLVPDEFALAEVEGDLDAADFRASHTAYWEAVGTPVTDDTLVVQLYFDLLPAGVAIRAMRPDDVDAIVELSLRAWKPVFASIHDTVGPRLFAYFYGGDWRAHQAGDVRRACSEYHESVAEDGGRRSRRPGRRRRRPPTSFRVRELDRIGPVRSL